MPKRLRLINVISGEESTLPTELVRPINLDNLIQMKFSLQNAFINSHSNRLMRLNKCMGPDERKTWRNSVGNQPSLRQVPPSLHYARRRISFDAKHCSQRCLNFKNR
jgi:hypothetical protein